MFFDRFLLRLKTPLSSPHKHKHHQKHSPPRPSTSTTRPQPRGPVLNPAPSLLVDVVAVAAGVVPVVAVVA